MLDGEVFLYYIAFHVSDKLNSHIPYILKNWPIKSPSFANGEFAKNVQQLQGKIKPKNERGFGFV